MSLTGLLPLSEPQTLIHGEGHEPSPLVSVVMSVFNGENYLSEAIDSVLDQEFADFEFIIINDGSNDLTGVILDQYQRKDSRVRVVVQENRGLVESLNRGCTLARGIYIARMDADDVALPNRLCRQVAFMEQHPEVGVVGGAVEFIDSTGKLLGSSLNPTGDAKIREALVDDCPFWHSTVVMRREIFLSTGGYRKAVVDAEDCDLWLRIADLTQLANLPTVLVRYRFHPQQVTVRKCQQQALSTLAAHFAAELRKSGRPDPLDSVKKITPEFLYTVGVGEVEQDSALAGRYVWNIRNLYNSRQYSQALVLFQDMQRARIGRLAARRVNSDLNLLAAQLLWREGRFTESFLIACRAVFQRPLLLGRPFKPLLRRLRLVGSR